MYRKIQNENVFIAGGKTFVTLLGYWEKSSGKIRYEVRAGKKGTGKLLAKVNCVYGAASQDAAVKKLKEKLAGLEFENGENFEKFHKAKYG